MDSIQNAAKRFSNVYVSLTNDNPSVRAPVPGGGRVCKYHSGEMTKTDSTMRCTNDAESWGRYLIVQLTSKVEFLILCEVQVFACQGNLHE